MTTKLLLLLVPLAACRSQDDGANQGGVIATMHGALTSMRTSPLPSPEVELVWLLPSQMTQISGAEHVAVDGLVSRFTLAIYRAPPDDLLDMYATFDMPLGMGLVVVGSAGSNFTDVTTWRGADLDHMVIYFPEAPAADGVVTAFVHAQTAPTKGFHLYTVKRLTDAERQQRVACLNAIPRSGMTLNWTAIYRDCGGSGQDELYPAPDDMDTELSPGVIEDGAVVQLINAIPRPLGD